MYRVVPLEVSWAQARLVIPFITIRSITLRKVCREAWQKQAGELDTLVESSAWEWRRRRLVRKFDRALINHAGSDNVDAILKRMDTRLESWLAADS
jgi:hypothetical protein